MSCLVNRRKEREGEGDVMNPFLAVDPFFIYLFIFFLLCPVPAANLKFNFIIIIKIGPRLATQEEHDTAGKDKPPRVPVPPSWRQVVSAAAGFLGVLLACIYGSRMLLVPPTVAVGGFYFILGGALLVPLQAPSVR